MCQKYKGATWLANSHSPEKCIESSAPHKYEMKSIYPVRHMHGALSIGPRTCAWCREQCRPLLKFELVTCTLEFAYTSSAQSSTVLFSYVPAATVFLSVDLLTI